VTHAFLPVSQPDLSGNEKRYVCEALDEGWISSSGRFLERFEREFAAFAGTKHAIACCNGTAVIHIALLALGIGPGDEVIVPTFTYVASANAITYTGATAVFVDSERVHWNLDPARIEAAITPRTKAILAVHLYGHPADMDAIRAIAREHDLFVVEDAAEAHGAEVNGRRVGSLGLVATFSFYGNKIVTTGEGGMITCDNDALVDRMRQLRGQGMDPKRRYWFPIVGYNYRMTNVAAAIGCAQLERVNELIAGRIRIAAEYDARLAPKAAELGMQLPARARWAKHVHWLYCIRVPKSKRDPLMAHLAEQKIETRPFFPPMHVLPMYRGAKHGAGPFPVAEELAATGINLPTWHAMKSADVERVSSEVVKFLAR
jgi:perosamine synthetase